jgi:hypothetical protein
MESLNDALIACITAAGGSKQVGPLLWPEKAPDSAQRMLLDCMNEDRPAKLSPEQVLLVLRLARAKGYHDGMNFIASDLGYGTPVPVEPRDEVADLMRAFNDSVAQQAALVAKIEKAASRVNMRAVA